MTSAMSARMRRRVTADRSARAARTMVPRFTEEQGSSANSEEATCIVSPAHRHKNNICLMLYHKANPLCIQYLGTLTRNQIKLPGHVNGLLIAVHLFTSEKNCENRQDRQECSLVKQHTSEKEKKKLAEDCWCLEHNVPLLCQITLSMKCSAFRTFNEHFKTLNTIEELNMQNENNKTEIKKAIGCHNNSDVSSCLIPLHFD